MDGVSFEAREDEPDYSSVIDMFLPLLLGGLRCWSVVAFCLRMLLYFYLSKVGERNWLLFFLFKNLFRLWFHTLNSFSSSTVSSPSITMLVVSSFFSVCQKRLRGDELSLSILITLKSFGVSVFPFIHIFGGTLILSGVIPFRVGESSKEACLLSQMLEV